MMTPPLSSTEERGRGACTRGGGGGCVGKAGPHARNFEYFLTFVATRQSVQNPLHVSALGAKMVPSKSIAKTPIRRFASPQVGNPEAVFFYL